MTVLKQKLKSPVNQQLLWLAEYSDGTFLAEFDFETQKQNKQYEINRAELLRFGLVGVDMPMYFETFGGNFNIAGRGIQVLYRVGDKDYPLIGRPQLYTNITSFKRGVAELDLTGGGMASNDVIGWGKQEGEVTEFAFGYNEKIVIEDIKFNFKAIVTVPFQKPVYMTFTVGADRELNGQLVILRNGVEIEVTDSPIDEEFGGEVQWAVQ